MSALSGKGVMQILFLFVSRTSYVCFDGHILLINKLLLLLCESTSCKL